MFSVRVRRKFAPGNFQFLFEPPESAAIESTVLYPLTLSKVNSGSSFFWDPVRFSVCGGGHHHLILNDFDLRVTWRALISTNQLLQQGHCYQPKHKIFFVWENHSWLAATFPHGNVVPLLIFSSDFIAVVDRWRSSTQNGRDPPHKMVEILHTSGGDPPHITGEIHFEYLNQLYNGK